MDYALHFDRKQRVLLVRFASRLDETMLLSMREAVGRFVAQEGSCRAIVDLSAVETVDVRSGFVAEFARSGPVIREHRRAIVTSNPELFGLGRMYELVQDTTEGSTRVVRTLAEACAALEIHALTLEAVGLAPAVRQ